MRFGSLTVGRDFKLVLGDSACNSFGMAGEQVLFGLLVYGLTGSSAWVGAAFALYFGPMLVFGALAGALADAVDRRRLLPVAELGIAATLALLVLLIALEHASLWPVLALTAVSGSVRAVYQPARSSYVYDLVGGQSVVAAFGWLNLSMRAGQLAGALAAGSLMQRFGAEYAYGALCTANLCAAALTLQLRSSSSSLREAVREPRSTLWGTLRELGSEMRVNRSLLMLVIVTASVETFGFSFVTALPELTEGLGGGPESLGAMHAARAAGGLLAGAALAAVGARLQRRGLAYLLVVYLFGAGLWLLAGAPGLVFAGFA
ncbi:MAG: MFS transporter, partial [Gammaproteobacteria bacterium]